MCLHRRFRTDRSRERIFPSIAAAFSVERGVFAKWCVLPNPKRVGHFLRIYTLIQIIFD